LPMQGCEQYLSVIMTNISLRNRSATGRVKNVSL
jgi:hypothetical protein